MRALAPSVALLALLLTSAACKQTSSILLIEVAGPKAAMPNELRVVVSAGPTQDTRSFLVPANATPTQFITLPNSFTLTLDSSYTGPVVVSIDALGLDTSGAMVPLGFSGTTKMDHIMIGGLTVVSVMLVEGLPPDQIDAGTDSGTDAGGGRGGAGAGGSGGGGSDGGTREGGAGGQGGAAGQGDGGPDGSGLDGAAD